MKYLNFDTLIRWFIADFWKIVAAFIVSAVVAVVVALSLPNEYTVRAKLMSNMGEGKALSGALAGLDGLASIAGVQLGGDEMSPEMLAEIMSSSSFLGSFADAHDMAPILFAAEGYDVGAEQFVYDRDIYDPETQQWTRVVKFPATAKPNSTEVTDKLREFMGASYDRKTKLVTVSFTSYSPDYAYEIVTKLIERFNKYIKQREVSRLSSTIGYLNHQLETAEMIEVRSAIQKVLEEQFKKLALAETRKDFAFEVIEAPNYPYQKSAPSRALLCAVISVFGTGIFVLVWWSVRAFRGKDV